MRGFALILLLLFVLNCSAVIEVFLVPHSHTDPGWLKTVEEYQPTVFQILSNVVQALRTAENRKFIWGETIYFKKWFELQDDDTQKYVKHLMNTGRFEMVGGGWVQNDEASCTYTSIIDQMSLGHQYLLERFGVRPKIAWQIDPFGHGGLSPELYANMGFDAVIINRVHHKIKTMMKSSASLEFIWKNGNTSIFAHTLHTHYSAVQGFDFEDRVPTIEDHNIRERAGAYVDNIKQRAKSYLTNFVLVPFGDDFKFQQASHQFSNMDKLINFINSNPSYDVKIRYSTLSDYFYSLQEKFDHVKFPMVKHDFFPYADNEDSYWTGHFTSLPNLKKKIRESESQLRATESSFAFATALASRSKFPVNWIADSTVLQKFRENVAVVQHHDSITGTCRTHVSQDYMRRVETDDAKKVEAEMISVILEADQNVPLLDINRVILEQYKTYSVLVHNTESHYRLRTLYIKSKTQSVIITGPSGENIPFQVIPEMNGEFYEIYMQIKVEGFAILKAQIKTQQDISSRNALQRNFVFLANGAPSPKTQDVTIEQIDKVEVVKISNDIYTIIFDKNTGYIKQIIENGKNHDFHNQFLEYSTQRSGSYIFRPVGPAGPFANPFFSIFISNGPLLTQAVVHTNRIKMFIRLFKDSEIADYIEIVHHIEPIPGNTEMVTRIGVNTGGGAGDIYTFDGLKFLKRFIHPNAPIAGKFYPSVAGALYRFPKSQVTVLTQQTMGMTATADELEFMIHRRLMNDDGRGMSQANADGSDFRFKLLLNYRSWRESEAHGINMIKIHQKSHSVNNPVTAYVTQANMFKKSLFQPLKELDPRLQIINFGVFNQATDDYIIRIQNLSPTKPMKFVMSEIFDPMFKITSIREKSLNLIYDVPHGKTIHAFRHHFKGEQSSIFDFTSDVAKSNVDTSQNTEEEGVFISSAAVEEKSTGQRKVLSVQAHDESTFTLPPGFIGTYIISIELNGAESGIIVHDHEKKGDAPIEDDEEEEGDKKPTQGSHQDVVDHHKEEEIKRRLKKEQEDDLYKEQHKPKVSPNIPLYIPTQPTNATPGLNFIWYLLILIVIIILIFLCCGKKKEIVKDMSKDV